LEERRTSLDSLAAVQGAEQKAEELLAAALRQCESLRQESEAEAERRAAGINEDARRRAQERIEEAELEAKRVVVAAEAQSKVDMERITADARRQAQERLEEAELEARALVTAAGSALEETRKKLSGFLADVLGEVEGAPATSEGTANVHDLDEVRGARTASADQ
jgi:hypothetical protein